MSVNQQAELTGWHNGLLNELLLVVPTEGTWSEALAKISGKLEETKNNKAWQGAQVTIDLGNRSIASAELANLVVSLKTSYGLVTIAVVATDTVTRESARALWLNTYLMLPGRSDESSRDLTAGNNALYIPQTVRSGQRVVHSGHLIIGGDVNPGAEVIAEGNIVVFGTLRGVAHAGSGGNETATISAGSMRPQLVRIAGQIARAPEESGQAVSTQRIPEIARIENEVIQVFPL